jgi:subtilisin-like proprotein convertase family protein
MIRFFTKVALLTVMVISISVISCSAVQSLWTDTPDRSAPVSRQFIPDKYRQLSLDLVQMKSVLESVPSAATRIDTNNSIVISLPLPDGGFGTFRVVANFLLMEPMKSTYPMIRTYDGIGIDDPSAVAKIDITQWGFHAMVMSPAGWYFIDPAEMGNNIDYISFYKKDSRARASFDCMTGNPPVIHGPVPGANTMLRSAGTQLKTYRLALACTGEYAAFYGGTKAGALAGMVTSVNRVNGVYELEMSVRLVLIGNDSLLVYTNSGTDPYTNNNGSTMLGQNQTNITNVIGSSNYDIGHVFSTGGGGVAGLGVVCSSSNKARGVTGSSSPIGDAFDIDYVAHEMGHQFGGNHTFNSGTGSCNGNRVTSAAYEPGSGTTIMAYAGICGADNIQPHSDPIFHTKNFDEIQTFITTGGGIACPVVTNTGNTPPTLNAGGNYSIPISTPFVLTGSGNDVNGDAVTYLWEEYDLGPQGSPNSPSGNAPIFRDFVPVSSPSRTFPKLADILSNTQVLGEILPSYSRSLQFRLTARDNRANGGGVTHNDTLVVLSVVNTVTPFSVTAPNTAITWTVGSGATVTWNVSSTNVGPISCANVKISLSSDGGNTFPIILNASTANDGTESIVVPAIVTSLARVKVEAIGNIFFDISNVNFTIQNASGALTAITTSPLSFTSICAGSAISVPYTANGQANAGNVFTAQLSNSAGSFASPVSIGTLSSISSGTINATIPAGTVTGTAYRIRVISSSPPVTGSNNGSDIGIYQTPVAAGNISGAASVCAGQNSVVYSVSPINNATAYQWTLPSGASVTSGANTNSITVSFSSSASSGNITVYGSNPGCNGITSTPFNVSVNPLPSAPGSITGTTDVCQNQSGVSYSLAAVQNASSYSWILPSGATIASGNNTNSITVNFLGNASSGYIQVRPVNSCGNGSLSSFLVNVNPAPAAPVITAGGSTTICGGGNVGLSTSPVNGISYQWRKNGIDVAGQTGSTYTANTTGVYDLRATTTQQSQQTLSNNTPASIPDNICSNVSSNITVSGYGSPVSSSLITVTLNISHTWVGDLVIVLVAPNGNVLGLSNQTGNANNSGDNFTNTTFSDAAAAVLPTTGAPYTGSYRPVASTFSTSCINATVASFAAIGGGTINPNGIWALKVYDMAAQDLGTINNWSLTLPVSYPGCSSLSNAITVNAGSAPVITSFSPSGGNAGSTVIISGSGFTNATSVLFNGVAASFTVNNDNQITATVPANSGNGSISVTTACGTGASNTGYLTAITLNLKLFIEGFYTGSGIMRAVLSAGVCDTIQVDLYTSSAPYTQMFSAKSTINLTGNGSFIFPYGVYNNSWYIVVKHRNSIETWSGTAIPFPGTSNTFDFTTGIAQAYGNNLVNMGSGKYAIRSGDVNRDGIINIDDYTAVQNSLTGFSSGYILPDITGDGIVESTDYVVVENNSWLTISVLRP